jgi:hypothetical protein
VSDIYAKHVTDISSKVTEKLNRLKKKKKKTLKAKTQTWK